MALKNVLKLNMQQRRSIPNGNTKICACRPPLLESLRSYDGDAEVNMNLYFTYQSRGTLKIFTLFITVKTTTKLNLAHSDKFEVQIFKISRRGSRSPDNAELSHFTLLFCRGRQRNVPRFITHVHSHCSAH